MPNTRWTCSISSLRHISDLAARDVDLIGLCEQGIVLQGQVDDVLAIRPDVDGDAYDRQIVHLLKDRLRTVVGQANTLTAYTAAEHRARACLLLATQGMVLADNRVASGTNPTTWALVRDRIV